MPDKYAILQLKETDETAWKRFMNFAYLREYGEEPNPEHYDLVYTGEFDFHREYPLEELFGLFNTKTPPDDFTGHPMSTSDIVAVVKDNLPTGYFYCDSYGFKRLPGFQHPAVEQMREVTDRGNQRLPGGN